MPQTDIQLPSSNQNVIVSCERCRKVLSDYISLSCAHDFCLECIALRILRGEAKGVSLPCYVCDSSTELGEESQQAIAAYIEVLVEKYNEKLKQGKIHNHRYFNPSAAGQSSIPNDARSPILLPSVSPFPIVNASAAFVNRSIQSPKGVQKLGSDQTLLDSKENQFQINHNILTPKNEQIYDSPFASNNEWLQETPKLAGSLSNKALNTETSSVLNSPTQVQAISNQLMIPAKPFFHTPSSFAEPTHSTAPQTESSRSQETPAAQGALRLTCLVDSPITRSPSHMEGNLLSSHGAHLHLTGESNWQDMTLQQTPLSITRDYYNHSNFHAMSGLTVLSEEEIAAIKKQTADPPRFVTGFSPSHRNESLPEDTNTSFETCCQLHDSQEITLFCFSCDNRLLCMRCVLQGEHCDHDVRYISKSFPYLITKITETSLDIAVAVVELSHFSSSFKQQTDIRKRMVDEKSAVLVSLQQQFQSICGIHLQHAATPRSHIGNGNGSDSNSQSFSDKDKFNIFKFYAECKTLLTSLDVVEQAKQTTSNHLSHSRSMQQQQQQESSNPNTLKQLSPDHNRIHVSPPPKEQRGNQLFQEFLARIETPKSSHLLNLQGSKRKTDQTISGELFSEVTTKEFLANKPSAKKQPRINQSMERNSCQLNDAIASAAISGKCLSQGSRRESARVKVSEKRVDSAFKDTPANENAARKGSSIGLPKFLSATRFYDSFEINSSQLPSINERRGEEGSDRKMKAEIDEQTEEYLRAQITQHRNGFARQMDKIFLSRGTTPLRRKFTSVQTSLETIEPQRQTKQLQGFQAQNNQQRYINGQFKFIGLNGMSSPRVNANSSLGNGLENIRRSHQQLQQQQRINTETKEEVRQSKAASQQNILFSSFQGPEAGQYVKQFRLPPTNSFRIHTQDSQHSESTHWLNKPTSLSISSGAGGIFEKLRAQKSRFELGKSKLFVEVGTIIE